MQKGMEIEEVDLSTGSLSKEEIFSLVTNNEGHMRGPIITKDDEVIVFGYNRDKLENLFP